jgi:4-amino-4-deoxy-L-arabinose transferase-like glycosyltransferase
MLRENAAPTFNPQLACLLAVIALFYTATIRPGHIWGDDFAMYVHHAQNIVEGQPYADTGYLFNPHAPVSPRMYPPVFPLLLAPVYRLFGLDLVPMKLEQVVFFVVTLAAVYAFWLRDLGKKYALALVAILGFSPVFWDAKDNVLSDFPFLLFFYVVALLVRWAPRNQPGWWRWAILIGFALYLAIGTRTAGIALIAGLLLYDVLKFHVITRLTLIALLVWAALLLLQFRLVGSSVGSYDGHLQPTLQTVGANLISYPRTLAGFWVASTRNSFSFFILGIVAGLTLAGIFFQSKRGLTIVEALVAPYMAMVILWPFSPGIRVVFPLLPWIVFLALTGLRGLGTKFAPRYSSAALCGLLLLISVPYGAAYRKADFGPIRQSNGSPEFNQLCQAVRDRTASDDVLIYYRARALSLYTGRTASSYNYRGTEQELRLYARNIHASYLITTNAFDTDHGFLERYAGHSSFSLELTYQNANFKLYRILSPADPERMSERR